MKNLKSLIFSSLVIALVLVLSVSGAWFTDTKSAGTAEITVGKAVTMEVSGTLTGSEVLPGEELTLGTVSAKASTGSADMYVRAHIEIDDTAIDASVLDVQTTLGSGWVKNSTDGYFYYTTLSDITSTSAMSALTKLAAGESSSALTIKVVVSKQATTETLVPGSKVKCTIVFQAIQAKNVGTQTIDATTNEWGSLPTNE